MRHGLTLLAFVMGVAEAAGQRVADPAAASVFIRVVGRLEVEVDAVWEESTGRGVELGTGSGFVFTPYGHVLTNHHVVSSESAVERIGNLEVEKRLTVERIEVLVPPEDPEGPPVALPASVEVSDPSLDLAVLSVTGATLPYLALGDSEAAAPGEDVRVYGFPFGRHVELGKEEAPDLLPAVSVSRGTVSAVRADDAGNPAFLQTNATVNPGSSGGPMVDAEGFVLGVVRLKLKEGDGIGFAIPVNEVKDFLEENGYGGLVPIERLRLGGEESLEGKGLTLRLPGSMDDRSPSRLRIQSDTSPSSIALLGDRVATSWDLASLEGALVGGEAFGGFHATGARKSETAAGGRAVLGSATGIDPGIDGEAKIEYAVFSAGGKGLEKVVLRYVGPAEAVAFNRSVLQESLRSARVDSLLGAPIERPIAPEGVSWEPHELTHPSSPSVLLPRDWDQEASAPFPCRGLPGVDSAIAVSPPGDFRFSLRAGWWSTEFDAASAARSCSARAGLHGPSSYAYPVEYLGARYVVSGAFLETTGGLLQLETMAPAEGERFVLDLGRELLDRNLRSLRR
jgi:S1-C subfamily serine protease